MAELDGHDAALAPVLVRESIFGEQFDQCAFRVLEDDGFVNAGRNARSALAADAVLGEVAGKRAKVASGRALEGKPRKRVRLSRLERNSFKALPRCEQRAPAAALDRGKPNGLRVISHLPVEGGGR